ncbi:class I SAM-dependent RNA methyltransferase [Microbacterium sp. SLBN-146]|uniref:class I SAM-dependent RNA methyltransferase n=1 Tax=Microbacterium sp. SLBN-146 TaxID=2768457 RepID=UPI0011518894|nr:TRAM domain-containing protein [Microbacterium sp. SLBN-146]TQJ32750.1 tRNA/tmRNA/rRNA uracil-C5-methylase (TrmA/RlmC/RlmD family) [Microbacterium sp. SLBN-146]
MDSGDLIDLDITGVAHGGVFVARHEGRVVFVSDAIPGERVRVRVTDASKSSFWRAETLEVLDASPHRQPHVWRQADVDVAPDLRPGGADFGHIDLREQRMLKLEVLTDSLRRFGGVELPIEMSGAEAVVGHDGRTVAEETDDGTGWRTRVSLHVDEAGRVGPYVARSHRVIPVDDLPLATPGIERAALHLTEGAPGRIDLVEPGDGRVRVIPRPEQSRSRGGRKAPRDRAKDPDREVVVERVDGRDFRVDAGGFWQVHRLAAHTLTRRVATTLRDVAGTDATGAVLDPEALHLDLYGGVGLFAATLASLAGQTARITSVESDVRATEHAGENLAEWVGARAETDRVDRWIARLAEAASATERERISRGVVLLDPPRSGAGRDVVRGIAALGPETVVYVACDPVAVGRDLGTFRAEGYETVRVDGLDLFPHSHHIEAVATLRRAGAGG